MDYRKWPGELGTFQKLSQTHAGNKAHVEGWFSQQSPFNKLAFSSIESKIAPAPSWMMSRWMAPIWLANRAYHWAWKGPANKDEDGTFLKYRDFTNEHYVFWRLPMTANEIDRAFVFVYEQQGKRFNWWGSARSWSRRFYRTSNHSKWFCSELFDAAMKVSGTYERLCREGKLSREFVTRDSGNTTPTMIFDNLCAPTANIVFASDNQVLGEQRTQNFYSSQRAAPVAQNVVHVSRKPRKPRSTKKSRRS